MKIIKSIFYVLLSVFFLINSAIANEPSDQDYENRVSSLLKEVYKDLPTKKNNNELVSYFKTKITEYFAVEYIANWSLGKYYNKNMDEQLKKDYVDAVVSYSSINYGTILYKYVEKYDYKVVSSEKKGANEYIVNVQISPNKSVKDSGAKIDSLVANLRVRYSASNKQFYIVDVAISGISILSAQRAEFEAQLNANGGDIKKLTDDLISKTKNAKIIN